MEKTLEQLIWFRANNACEYCKMPQAFDPLAFQIDHIIAIQHLGETIDVNLALACYACNRHKGPNIAGFDQVTRQVIPLFHPRQNIWAEHFAWRGAEIVGLTASGRVTVHVLAINLDYRVALRQSLMYEGILP